MIYLHTLGDALIKVGEKEIRPSSPMVFAALLYLAVERGRRVPRAALQEMLFPNADERSGAHSLRQLLYKLRQLGASVEVDAAGARIAADNVIEDISQRQVLERLLAEDSSDSFAILPFYGRSLSQAHDQWLSNYRDRTGRRLRGLLEQLIVRERNQGVWSNVERYSRLLRRIDPLSEAGLLGVAQALAMTGSTPRALKSIDEYCAELGDHNVTTAVRQLRTLLRRQSGDVRSASSPIPLCGRAADLAALLDFLHRRERNGHAIVVSGVAGIGKTRLVQEFCNVASLEGFRVEWCTCSEADSRRPSAVLSRIVSRLLGAPGALGTAPTSLALLRRLTDAPLQSERSWANAAENEALRNALGGAIQDLVEAVAAETPLCIVVEDVQWIDVTSIESLLSLTSSELDQRLLLVFTSRERSLSPVLDQHTRVLSYPIEPISDQAATELLERRLEGVDDRDFIAWAVKVAIGNPFFLNAIASFYQHTGTPFALPPSLRVLIRQSVECLEVGPRGLLEAAAVLGRNSSVKRMARVVGLGTRSLLPFLRELELRGLVRRHDEWVGVAHDLLRDEVLALTPPASRSVLHGIVAEVLFREGKQSRNAALLWDCADHWSLAGDISRSVEVVLSCVDHLVNIGEVNAAYDLLTRAQTLRLGSGMAYRIAQAAAIISFSTENIEAARTQIVLMRKLSTSVQPTAVDHDELELLETEIRRLSGASISDRAKSLLGILENSSTKPRHRLHAALLLLINADVVFDNRLAERVIAVVPGVAVSTSIEEGFQLSCQLIYSVVFGNLARVPEIVEAFDRVIAAQPTVLTIRHRLNIAVALFRAGRVDAATQRLNMVYDLADSFNSKSIGFMVSSKIALLGTLTGMPVPAEWQRRIQELGHNHPMRTLMLIEFHCLDLLKTGSISEALKALQEYRQLGDEREASRWLTTLDTLEIWLATKTYDRDKLEFHCDRLLRVHPRAAVCGIYDHEMEALYVGLSALGKTARAQSLLQNYVSAQRRDGFAPPPSLQCLIDLMTSADRRSETSATPESMQTA